MIGKGKLMRLKYSRRNLPYITFENDSMLIFSKTTEDEKFGFKYLVFNGYLVSDINISGAKAKKKILKKVYKSVNFVINMNMKRPTNTGSLGSIPAEARKAGFSKIVEVFLRKTFKPLIDEKGYFPRENLSTLEKMLEKTNGSKDDELDEDPTATESFDD